MIVLMCPWILTPRDRSRNRLSPWRLSSERAELVLALVLVPMPALKGHSCQANWSPTAHSTKPPAASEAAMGSSGAKQAQSQKDVGLVHHSGNGDLMYALLDADEGATYKDV